MTGVAKSGGEFLVNTTTLSTQANPATTGLADGRFVVTWDDWSQTGGDTSSGAVRGQVFNADGSKAGAEFVANTATWDAQYDPAVAALPDGRFVSVWSDFSKSAGDTSGLAIRAQLFNPDGTKTGPEFVVNTTTFSDQDKPDVAALANGNFVVTWHDNTGDMMAQVFDANGAKVGAQLVAGPAAAYQVGDKVAALSNGDFVVTWTEYDHTGDPSGAAIRTQLFHADGAKLGGEFLVNTTTNDDQDTPAVTALAGGGFVESWTDWSQTDGDVDTAIRAQVFNADGSKSGAEFMVNTTTTSVQYSSDLAALPDGRFVAAWTDGSLTGGNSDFGIKAQVFNADGSKFGAEFLANTTTAGAQDNASVSALADGRFVVSWTDPSQSGGDTSFASVRAQIFDTRDSAVLVGGTGHNDDYVGTGFNDTMLGAGGNDHLTGAGGDDFLFGGAGDDTMVGGAGNDSFVVDGASDVVSELANGGTDTVYTNLSYTLGANVENLTLIGTANLNGTGNGLANSIMGNDGANILNGAGGNDTLVGGAGNDTFVGGAGKELMTGGGGLDHFNFASLADSGTSFATRDVINTFAHGDKVDLSALDANSAVAGNQAFAFVTNFTHAAGQLEWTQTAPTGYLIQADTNGDGAADFSLQIYAAPNFGTIHNWDFTL